MEEVYCGKFWINGNTYKQISGYIKNGKLILSESFFPKKTQFFTSGKITTNKKIDYIINGKIIDGDLISLIGLSCWDNNLEIKEYFFNYMVIGKNYDKYEDIKFKYFDFSFNGLFEFIGKGLLELKKINSSGGDPFFDFDELNIKINKTGKALFESNINNFNLSLISGYNYNENKFNTQSRNLHYDLFKGIVIQNNVRFRIKGIKSNLSIEEIEKIIENIQKLFSIILGKDIKINNLKIFEEYFWTKKEKEFLKLKKDSIIKEINIIFKRGFLASNFSKKENNNKINILFGYQEVKNIFGKILENWFKNINNFRTIYNLYYVTLQNKDLHLENQFLNLVQAIDGMFWKVGIKVEIKGKIYLVNNSLSKTKKDTIGKEYGLVKKMGEIEKYLGIEFKIKGEDMKEEIKNIRNILSHGGDKDDINLLNLINLVELLKIVFNIFLVKELLLDEKLYDSIKEYKINTELKLNILDKLNW